MVAGDPDLFDDKPHELLALLETEFVERAAHALREANNALTKPVLLRKDTALFDLAFGVVPQVPRFECRPPWRAAAPRPARAVRSDKGRLGGGVRRPPPQLYAPGALAEMQQLVIRRWRARGDGVFRCE
jgi:hypothetical protein